jgi:hypothetical protein
VKRKVGEWFSFLYYYGRGRIVGIRLRLWVAAMNKFLAMVLALLNE